VAHAAIDLDPLGAGHVHAGAADDLTLRNVASVWRNYAEAGVTNLLLAGAVENAAELTRIRAAAPSRVLFICRLMAPIEVLQRRVGQREAGIYRDRYIARAARLEAILDAAALEHFRV